MERCCRLSLRYSFLVFWSHSLASVFSNDRLGRRRRSGRGRRDGEGDPGIPAEGPVFRSELSVGLQIKIALHVADWKQEPDLGTDANHLGLEAANTVARAGVAAD